MFANIRQMWLGIRVCVWGGGEGVEVDVALSMRRAPPIELELWSNLIFVLCNKTSYVACNKTIQCTDKM